jgi:prophage regulatory protein
MTDNLIHLPPSGVRMLRLPEVKYRVGLGRSSIYDRIKRREFPAPVHLGPRAVAWNSDEITDWIEARVTESCSPATSGSRSAKQHDLDDNVKVIH